jgi:FKBP-type peptidyl-prolyl cis-trans isomerase
MKLVKLVVVMAVVALIAQGCGSSERKTESGLTYTLIEEGDGELPVDGEYLVMNMTYGMGDSTWMDTQDGYPVILPKEDSMWRQGGKIHEIFADLKGGDSVTFSVDAETLFTKTWQQQVPPELNPQDMITFNIGVDSTMTGAQYANWQQQMMDKERIAQEAMMKEQLEKDIALIEEYLAENNIEAQKTESGLHYVIHEKGTGEEANQLDTVRVSYEGYLLSGQYFDTSIEEVAVEKGLFDERREYGPLEFVIGRDRIIRGWHEGFDLLSEGAKATFYIPSRLGYGPNPMGDKIQPNSVLAFDVELLDVK